MVASGEPTEYFQVDPAYPEAAMLLGNHNGELINEGKNGMAAHFAPGSHVEEGKGSRHAHEGNGDIVIERISAEGWRQILAAISGVDGSRSQIANVITQLPWVTWNRPQSGH